MIDSQAPVLLSDFSDEARELGDVLRDAGFSLIQSDAVALPERCVRLRPLAALIDIEQVHALEAIRRIRDQQGAATRSDERDEQHPATLILPIGSDERLAELGVVLTAQEHAFPRPVDPAAIAAWLHRVVAGEPSSTTALGSGGVRRATGRAAAAMSSGRGVPSGSAPGLGAVSGVLDSEPLLADFPALADLPEVDVMLLDGEPGSAPSGARQLSPEINAILEQSARRARELATGPAEATTHDVLLPPELIAPLEEILLRDARRAGAHDSEPPPARRSTPASAARTSRTPVAPPATRSPLPPALGVREVKGGSLAPEAPATVRPPDVLADANGAKTIAPATDTQPPSSRAAQPSYRRDGAPESEPPATRAQLPSFPFIVEAAHHARRQPPAVSTAAAQRGATATAVPVGAAAAESEKPQRGDAIDLIARAIRTRATGSLRVASEDGVRVRHVLLRDGDVVTVASELEEESLANLLVERGDVPADLLRARRFPRFGRHAAAALIAQGFLSQDDLWPVLRAHAEWTLARTLREGVAVARLLPEPPERFGARGAKLADEPSVFGGATGVEVLVDVVRRVLHPADALARLGGGDARIEEGELIALLHESALDDSELAAIDGGRGATIDAILSALPDGAPLIFALAALGVVRTIKRDEQIRASRSASEPRASGRASEFDPLDADAIRKRVAARLALIHEGNYFALLGVAPDATSYDVRRAYIALRRSFEPARLLTAATADLKDDLLLILDVLQEAYEVLRDDHRRARYRRAIEAVPKA